MAKSKTISIYLFKDSVRSLREVFSESIQEAIKNGGDGSTIIDTFSTDKIGDGAKIYIFKSRDHVSPKWLPWIKEVVDGVNHVNISTASAVVVFKCADRIWAVPFSYGWSKIDDEKIETDFGLKVAINSLSDEKLRRIDVNNLGVAMKSARQSASQKNLYSFGVDEALDLVRRISGRVEGGDFVKSLSGATSLKVTKEMSLSELCDIAQQSLERYMANDYKNTAFVVIDKVSPIIDKLLVSKLDQMVVDSIRDGEEYFELSLPGWQEDDVVCYGLSGLGIRERFTDITLENYITALGDEGLKQLSVETITHKHGIFAELLDNAQSKKRVKIKKALVGSIVSNGHLYAISEGNWYQLDEQYKNEVDNKFESMVEEWDSHPLQIRSVKLENGKTGYEKEIEYNRRCADEYGQVCLDGVLFSVSGEAIRKLELCDLLDIDNKRLIHVKKSSRRSSVLSHFFRQGGNSARVLATYPEVRRKMIDKVRNISGEEAASKLNESFEHALSGWKVEFHIIDTPIRRDNKFKIPFFSRISLREEARVLEAMGLGVCIRFIGR